MNTAKIKKDLPLIIIRLAKLKLIDTYIQSSEWSRNLLANSGNALKWSELATDTRI